MPRLAITHLALAASLLAFAAPADAATTCAFDAAAAKLNIDYSTGGTARISRNATGAILVDGAACATATVRNTDTIVATGGGGLHQLVVDLSGGPLAPGKTAETGTGALSEIEIAFAAGDGGESPLGDELRIVGTATADTLRFSARDALLNGDADADVTTTGVEAVAAEGRGGDDRLLGDGSGGAMATPELRLSGGDGADELTGGDGHDTLDGGAGDDIELGGPGGDTFAQGAAPNGADSLDGGSSSEDRIDYSARTAGVRIDSDDIADDGAAGERDDVRDSMEFLAGGAGDDVIVASQSRYQTFRLIGNGGADTLTGGTYWDSLQGGDGNDTLNGGDGPDDLRAGPGDDIERGDEGGDVFYESESDGANGADSVTGGPGDDQYYAPERKAPMTITLADNLANDGEAGEGDNVRSDVELVTSGRGADRITGSVADNRIVTSSGDDVVNGGGGADVLFAGVGNDAVAGGPGADKVYGEDGDDTFTEPMGNDGADRIDGGYGADAVSYNLRSTAVAVTLNDTADDGAPGEGDDVRAERVIGSRTGDTLTGSSGRDRLEGAGGADTVDGLGEADTLLGGDAADALKGGDGDDLLDGGSGADVLLGEEGTDRASYATRTTAVTITLGNGPGDGAAGEGDDVRTEDVVGGGGADRLTGDHLGNALDGGAGNDVLDGGTGADVLTGAAGTDTATYAARTARVTASLDGVANDGGDAEGDAIGATVENLTGGSGPDTLSGDAAANALLGGTGDDRLDGRAGADLLDGQVGRDTIDYTARTRAVHVNPWDQLAADGEAGEGDTVSSANEIFRGGSGDDRLIGTEASNELYGGPGADTLTGGPAPRGRLDGHDILSGGTGTDTAAYDERISSDPVKVTLDGQANDGKADGTERDNVLGDVENLVGGFGNDELVGDARANVLAGGTMGDDTLRGEGGDDRFDDAADPPNFHVEHDEFFGGEGSDVVDYSRRTTALAVSLDDVANDGVPTTDGSQPEADNVHADIEGIEAGAGQDNLVGDGDANRIHTGNGGDRVEAGGGNDTIVGGTGVDRVFGQDGDDRITAGPGNNSLDGGAGDDTFVEASSWVGNDGFTGGPGRDTVDYGARRDRVLADNDGVSGDDGQDIDRNGDAEEKDRVGADVEVIAGGSGSDVLTQTRAQQSGTCVALYGGPGADVLTGHDDANDVLQGGPDGDTLHGKGRGDWLVGGPGSDTENGGDGDDRFIQGDQHQKCTSIGWTDIAGGDGADVLNGDGGTDTVEYRRTKSAPVRVYLDELPNDGGLGEGDSVKVENVWGGDGDDLLVGDSGANLLGGDDGNDRVEGRGGDDELFDLRGVDELLGGDGWDTFRANDGDNADELNGGGGVDSGEWDAGDIRTEFP